MKKPVFLCFQTDLTVYTFSTVVSALVATFKTAKYDCKAPDYYYYPVRICAAGLI